jgi:hypothetical protein
MSGRHAAPAQVYRPVLQSGCEDCGTMDTHRTRTEAVRAIWAHWVETGHDALIADNNGWHRIWLENEPLLSDPYPL